MEFQCPSLNRVFPNPCFPNVILKHQKIKAKTLSIVLLCTIWTAIGQETSNAHISPVVRSIPDYLNGQEKDIALLYKKSLPSVVTIYTKSKVVSEAGFQEAAGLGSGVLISKDCHVLTAAHVVGGTTDILVKTQDGKFRKANVLFSDKSADIALLRLSIPDASLLHASMGDSNQLVVGQNIYAIGSPYGLENSFSSGIISAFRGFDKINDGTVKVEFIQTDAAINSGNSGGPLFNSKGEVVGIASSILTVSGGFQGIGMAVSINTAKELLSFEDRPWIGVDGILMQKEEYALLFNLDIEGGLLVQSVAAQSPADKAGIRGGNVKATIKGIEVVLGGDIITSIGNHYACHVECLVGLSESINKKKEVEVTYLRNGKYRTVKLDLQETKQNFLQSSLHKN